MAWRMFFPELKGLKKCGARPKRAPHLRLIDCSDCSRISSSMVVIPALKEVTELLLGRQRQTAEVLRGVDHRLPGRGCLGEFGERRVIVAVAVGVDKDRVRKRKGLEPGLRNHRPHARLGV